MQIVKKPSVFVARDGREFANWNAARRHETQLDLLDCIKSAAPGIADANASAACEAILRGWHVSKRKGS